MIKKRTRRPIEPALEAKIALGALREPATGNGPLPVGEGADGEAGLLGELDGEGGRAETATRTGQPKVAVFCTISIEQRLVTTTKPAAGSTAARPGRSDFPPPP